MATSITKPQVLQQPFCNSGDKNSIPSAATGTNLASLAEGFPTITSLPIENNGIPPERRDFNGLGNLLSQFCFAFQNGWFPTFDSNVSTAIGGYASGAVLWYETDQCFVVSLKNNNTDNFVTDPTKIDGVSWKKIIPGVHVIETYSNNGSWYRVWSDGWCEQGGESEENVQITFLKPFTDTNYGMSGMKQTEISADAISFDNKTASSVILRVSNDTSGSTLISWQAYGYII